MEQEFQLSSLMLVYLEQLQQEYQQAMKYVRSQGIAESDMHAHADLVMSRRHSSFATLMSVYQPQIRPILPAPAESSSHVHLQDPAHGSFAPASRQDDANSVNGALGSDENASSEPQGSAQPYPDQKREPSAQASQPLQQQTSCQQQQGSVDQDLILPMTPVEQRQQTPVGPAEHLRSDEARKQDPDNLMPATADDRNKAEPTAMDTEQQEGGQQPHVGSAERLNPDEARKQDPDNLMPATADDRNKAEPTAMDTEQQEGGQQYHTGHQAANNHLVQDRPRVLPPPARHSNMNVSDAQGNNSSIARTVRDINMHLHRPSHTEPRRRTSVRTRSQSPLRDRPQEHREPRQAGDQNDPVVQEMQAEEQRAKANGYKHEPRNSKTHGRRMHEITVPLPRDAFSYVSGYSGKYALAIQSKFSPCKISTRKDVYTPSQPRQTHVVIRPPRSNTPHSPELQSIMDQAANFYKYYGYYFDDMHENNKKPMNAEDWYYHSHSASRTNRDY